MPASVAHIGPVANRMRAIDRIEAAVFGYTPKAALRHALNGAAMAWTARVDGRPECLFGVTAVSTIEGIGSPWLLMTDHAAKQRKALVSQVAPYLDKMQRAFPRLENRVHARNAKAVRWLSAMGFTIDGETIMVSGEPFRLFHRG